MSGPCELEINEGIACATNTELRKRIAELEAEVARLREVRDELVVALRDVTQADRYIHKEGIPAIARKALKDAADE